MRSNEIINSTALTPTDPYTDPVSYLAALGIDAELVGTEDHSLLSAA